ncbi:allantoinase AllB [soil metagenome]
MTDGFDVVLHATSALIEGEFREAWIGVTDGAVSAIGTSEFGGPIVELAEDEVLIPGIVDTHVHVNEPGRTEWEGFASATRAAAAGGVTTIIDMPLNSVPATTTVEALETKRDVARVKAIVDVGFWGGAVPENLGSLEELWDAGVFGFKCFLAPSGVDEFGHLDTDQLHDAMREIQTFNGLLIVHAEDPGVLQDSARDGGTDYHSFVESRPDASEVTAIEHVINGVRETGVRAHILHLSSAAALPALAAARKEGLPITVETCPHYLTIAEEQIPVGATQFKCCPPIRDDANRDALWQALLDGVIDIVVTDHSPSTAELKFSHGGDFQKAWGGIAGLQTGFAAVWTEARKRGIPLEAVVAWMSQSPAQLVGLRHKGHIRVGSDADFVAFAPEAAFDVHADQLQHKNPVSAYDGRHLHGVARTTWLAGVPLSIAADAPVTGELLRRHT